MLSLPFHRLYLPPWYSNQRVAVREWSDCAVAASPVYYMPWMIDWYLHHACTRKATKQDTGIHSSTWATIALKLYWNIHLKLSYMYRIFRGISRTPLFEAKYWLKVDIRSISRTHKPRFFTLIDKWPFYKIYYGYGAKYHVRSDYEVLVHHRLLQRCIMV